MILIGLLLAALWQPGEADLRRAVQSRPRDPAAHSQYALFLQESGRAVEALAHFRSAFDLAPQSSEYGYNLALALLHADRATDALAILDKQDHPALRGAVLNGLGRTAEAAESLRRAVKADPGNADTLYDLVLTLSKAGQAEEAARLLDDGRRRFPRVAKIHAASGMLAYLHGKNADAVRSYETAVKLEPAADLYAALGDVHDATGDLARAESAYRASLRLDGSAAAVHVKLGKNLAKLQRPAEAARAFDAAVKLDASNADAHFQLGKLAAARSDHAAAVRHYQQAVACAPDLKEAWYQLGVSYKRTGNEEQSALALDRFRSLP